ncbi:hypothetical protein LEN26_007023 [Aphanomyces euteiches]|uniref:COX assembly mitochondrial protein n=1 Tax=Aphanomyces euteiches TaxID=100861 RepID=A0A6G0WI51_9STRA|nr:hypothetical protein Ae201684_015000 [Aphanomyces euteiches]KAH9076886.1 hypothetical protein Ae201684P_010817 [Aphanomyces euteiches]KAH9104408.1 hypothetical protein AeMF1_019491 [Aphanomyces euteiches]KAH9133757.1 hypothetical protein LEN26_007023 [Aphanomyces euteiches]KAH9142364.1 hypothetical protein AeRB84_013556 [Aphanomyces euteiches]
MHSSLDKPHPVCQEIVDALRLCHAENPWMKFTGACNDVKAALNDCFLQENQTRRKANLEKARAFDQKWKEHKSKQQAEDSSA